MHKNKIVWGINLAFLYFLHLRKKQTNKKTKKEKSASDIKKTEYSHVINRDSFQLNIMIFDIYFLHTSDW